MDVVDDAEGPLDPRIQIELENLNTATDDINKLEIELDEAHTAFGQLLAESTRRLNDIKNKVGTTCIIRARCYYEAREIERQARVQCQYQAQAFQRASEIHAAAKETVAVAEARFMSHQHEWNFDQAWQDMLNHATIKVMDAENKKAECRREHHRRATLCNEAEMKVQQLDEKYRRSIVKAEPYFEMRDQYDQMLATQKERVECLKKAVKDAKRSYSASFRALEDISNQIHQQRRDYDMVANGPREPGVGAELISPEDSLNYEAELNKVSVSRLNSLASSGETDTEDRSKDFADVCDLKKRVDQLGGRSIDGSESVSSQWELELQASMEKLNNLSMKNPNWQNAQTNDTESTKIPCLETLNDRDDSKCGSRQTAKTLKNDQNEHKKLPIEFQILNKLSSTFGTTSNTPDGRQSLTHSPINSILNRSKIAIRNSISKSLSNSPVNMSFGFGRSRIENLKNPPVIDNSPSHNIENHRVQNSIEDRKDQDSIGDFGDRVSIPPTSDESIDSRIDSRKTSNRENSCLTEGNNLRKMLETAETKESYEPKEHKSRPVEVSTNQKKSYDEIRESRKNEISTHSVNSTPVRSKILLSRKSAKSFDGENVRFVKSSSFKNNDTCKTSSVRELPLLSFFGTNTESRMSKDKSCSMINLAEKHNLKTLLDNPNLRNIQAVSVERLASARNNIMGEHSEAGKNFNRK